MKVLALILTALLASASAAQVKPEGRFVDSIIIGILESVSQELKDLELDPFEFTDDIDLKLAVTDIFHFHAHLEEFVMNGISNIVLNDVTYDVSTSTLTFDVAMPSISFSLDSSSSDLTFFGYRLNSTLSGSLDIVGTRLRGTAVVEVGVITGTHIKEMNIAYSLDNIVSNLQLAILDEDHSDKVNEILGDIIPTTLHDYSDDINEVLEYYIVYFFHKRD